MNVYGLSWSTVHILIFLATHKKDSKLTKRSESNSLLTNWIKFGLGKINWNFKTICSVDVKKTEQETEKMFRANEY